MLKQTLYLVIIILFSLSVLSITDEEKAQIKDSYEQMKEEISTACQEDPYTCSCDRIPCEDILNAENEDKDKAYDKCVEKRDECDKNRDNAISEMETLKSSIEKECRKDITKCDCSQISSKKGKEDCKLAVTQAKFLAETEKKDKITSCMNDLETCDCSAIENDAGKEECKKELNQAKILKDKIKKACSDNPINCDCSSIASDSGKKECETAKKDAYDSATGKVKEALSKCFKNVDKCDCNNLGLSEQSYIDFCSIQLSFGLNCKYKSLDCDKLDNVEIYPPGMPSWLGTFFKKEYASYVNKEKEKAVQLSLKIANDCINNLDKCDCSQAPYGSQYCQRQKELQQLCYADNYDACVVLENTSNIPPGMPAFIAGPLDSFVSGLRKAREGSVKTAAAKKVGAMILLCMNDSALCDCSIAPSGNIKAFCEHKKELVIMCRDRKDYPSCFRLSSEPLYTSDMPAFIRDYISKEIQPKVDSRKVEIYNEMKKGTRCDAVLTLAECERVYAS